MSEKIRRNGKAVCWFSCGAASAVATKLALRDHPNADIIYQDTGSEHPDSLRFLKDCEQWFGQDIRVIRSDRYRDTWEVWEERRYIAGVQGAPCTAELKRKPAENLLFEKFGIGTVEVFGYTIEEQHRLARWKANNMERIIEAPLIERGLSKGNCLAILEDAGIKLPELYRLGYRNNNCIGCPKGGAGYWNKIRRDFPEVFERMAKLERKLNAAICKSYGEDGERQRVFLDELPEDAGRYEAENISCGLFCMEVSDEI